MTHLFSKLNRPTIVFNRRTTKSSTWPNISYIQRKPKPLGAEYKNFVCSKLNVMGWLELQEGKVRMIDKPFSRELGVTVACVTRAVDAGKFFLSVNINQYLLVRKILT